MSVAILSIGTELTRGEIQNTNATWLCTQLTELGIEVVCCETIPDTEQAIGESLLRLGAKSQVILSTGGLGPTTDDITAHSVATCLGLPLVRDAKSYELIRALVERRGRVLTESSAKQADFPSTARVLSNAVGTAPGFAVPVGRATAYFMPGVPGEMKPMFTAHVLPVLQQLAVDFTACVRIKTHGAPESVINDALAGIEQEHNVIIGYRAHFPEVEVKVLAQRKDRAQAEAHARAVATLIEQRLGKVVYGQGSDTLPGVVASSLRSRGLTLGLAESCTGGLLAELLTEAPASDYFLGSIVSYANSAKQGVLGVPSEVLDRHGAVSEAVVVEMATRARTILGSDCALAISGVAGPSGGTDDKPVGRVHFALAVAGSVETAVATFNGDRRQIQHRAAFFALDLLRHYLNQAHA